MWCQIVDVCQIVDGKTRAQAPFFRYRDRPNLSGWESPGEIESIATRAPALDVGRLRDRWDPPI